MSIFGKKTEKKTVQETVQKTLKERMDELLKEINGLPEEEQKKFWDELEKNSPDEQEPTTDEIDNDEEEDSTEPEIADDGSDVDKDEERYIDPETEEDREEEPMSDNEYVEKKELEDVIKRIEALEALNHKDNDELPKPQEEESSEDWDKDTDFFKE